MSRFTRWLIVILLALTTLGIATAAASMDTIYFPVVIKDPTRTPTQTPTPTNTLVPTATNTPTPTATEQPSSVQIVKVVFDPPSELDEYVEIKNNTNGGIDMEDWVLRDENRNIFFFPPFTLAKGKTVKVWTKSGDDTSTDLYWDSDIPIWNDVHDCAYLRDDNNVEIDRYCY